MTNRQRFVDRMKAELDEWDDKIERLRLRAALGKMEAREDIEDVRERLRAKLRPMRTKLKELSGETDEAWDDVAAGFKDAWTDVKTGLKNAVSQYR